MDGLIEGKFDGFQMRLQMAPLLGRQGREEPIADGRTLPGGLDHAAPLRVLRR